MACWVNPDGTIQCSDLNLSAATFAPIAREFGQHAKTSTLVTPNLTAQLAEVAKRLATLGAPTVVLVLDPSELPAST